MRPFRKSTRAQLMLCAAVGALAIGVGSARAEDNDHQFDIAPQSLTSALYEFGAKSTRQVMFTPDVTASKMTGGVHGAADEISALEQLLTGTGLSYRTEGDVLVIVQAGEPGRPQSGSAAGDGADGTVQALIVTAQKREEDIQDVPIAISAFTEKTLQEQKIEGGFDLLKAIPNVTFSKNNFTSYNFSIRGIGTKAVSATTDPGVAVAFNNVPLLQNRLFEQEYFDVERVEVLRGPQGTLYGRNATAGVINVISAKPNLHEFDGWIKGEVGNYHAKRLSAMVNVPLIEDKLAIRFAGALTDRQGYDYNELTKNHINGRDLWSGRVTVAFTPTETIRTNLIWERFNEDDNRSRTGKQLCHRDPGLTSVGGTPVVNGNGGYDDWEAKMRPAMFSQGCMPGSLYDDAAFGTPNGLALPFVFGLVGLKDIFSMGYDSAHQPVTLLNQVDPYASATQSRDLRTIESIKDPRYRAKADIVELNVDVGLTDSLTFSSQTAYNKDQTYSFQDFNRFNTQPIFNDTSSFVLSNGSPSPWRNFARGGIFCDPQLGCTDRLVGFDIAQGKATQFNQEFRLQSDFEGPVNFSVGANYTHFKTLIDYYVFYNLITAMAMLKPFNDVVSNPNSDIGICSFGTNMVLVSGNPTLIDAPGATCPYVDPNPIESINGEGHNYFRSKNPYKVTSTAAFGELYWQATDALKVTAGLRYTDDRKTFIPVPSQILTAPGLVPGGTVNKGYPEKPAIKQHWGEWTGRLGVDWKPDLSFTDQTMLYAFYSRGYKGGGANPPTPGFATPDDYIAMGFTPEAVQQSINLGLLPVLELTGVEYGRTFDPEFVNAYEIGAKNTLLGGALMLNTDAFFYDYKDYQVSQIRDRSAVNENFDARAWGLELETTFAPSRNFQVIGNIGYLDTRIADGEMSIDIMDRTAGTPGWIVTKPWAQLPSNCILPVGVVQHWLTHTDAQQAFWKLCGGARGILSQINSYKPIDPATGLVYDPNYYDGTDGRPDINGGAGIAKELGGNRLPNAPHWTMNIGAQYGHDILDGSWRATVRADAYWQSQSWARVYNDDPYDKLHGWYNVNLSVWFERPEDDLKIELYAKNLLDKTPITDAFLNSDDTALTTNVFVLDPRLIGLSIRKGF